MFALNQGRNDWYRIRNQIDGPTQVYIYDEIGYMAVGAGDFIRDMADVNGPIEVHINSPGGDLFDGIAIYNALVARPNVTVVVDGLAASIASVIAMAGNPVLVARQASMMVHQPFTMAIGNSADLRDLAENLDRQEHALAEIYSTHTGKSTDYWKQIMKAETWYSSQEAIDDGLADRFVDSGAGRPVTPPTEAWDLSAFRAGHLQAGASVPYIGEREHRHVPMTGTHTHDHAAFDASDHDDGVHEHIHSHKNDADHHHTHSMSGTAASGKGGVDNSPVDRPQAKGDGKADGTTDGQDAWQELDDAFFAGISTALKGAKE
jgi:ATP-dependent Clp endopeptidase proteolytic subunit ClpP